MSTWPSWFRYTVTAALSLGVGAFGVGQVWEARAGQATQALQAAGEANGKVDALAIRTAELESWRRGEEAARAALSKQLEAMSEALKAQTAKVDELAKSVHRIEGAVMRQDK